MPKIISEEEKQKTRDYLYKKGITLIKEKGLRKVTVEDIARSIGIAKGSFYQYYDSKESYLYEVLKRNEKESFEKMLAIQKSQLDKRSQLLAIFDQILMSDEVLFMSTEPEDLLYLLTRLPGKFEEEQEKSDNNFQAFTEAMGLKLTSRDLGALSYLMDSMQQLAKSQMDYGEEGKKKAMQMIKNAIISIILGERE